MRTLATICLLLAAGCSGWKVRPFAEAELYEHKDYNDSSAVTAGATFLSRGGCSIDVGPSMRFDFLGGRTQETFDNQIVGGVVRLRFLK